MELIIYILSFKAKTRGGGRFCDPPVSGIFRGNRDVGEMKEYYEGPQISTPGPDFSLRNW